MTKWFLKMKARYYLVSLIFFIFLTNSIYAVQPIITINENSSLIKLLNGKYKLEVTGIVKIYNPSSNYSINEFSNYFLPDSLISINIKNLPNSSINFFYKNNRISCFLIPPNTNASFRYYIYGIIDNNIYNKTNETIYQYYTSKTALYTDLIINLQKPEREDKNITNVSNRLITYGFENPSDFDLNINSVNIYHNENGKLDNSPNTGVLIDQKVNITLNPFEFKLIDFFDKESYNNIVYWLTTDINIKYKLRVFQKRSYSVERFIPNNDDNEGRNKKKGSGSRILSYFLGDDKEETSYISKILIKKSADKTLIKRNDTIKITLNIINLLNNSISNISVIDSIPNDYKLIKSNREIKINNNKLSFYIENVDRYDNEIITYDIINLRKYKGVTYLKPAELHFLNFTFYSEGVLLINELLPNEEESIYIQKEIIPYKDDFVLIKIKVKNIGNKYVNNLLISEVLYNNSIIKDITKPFYKKKGTWLIKELLPNEEWEVSFIAKKGSVLTKTLPNIYGIDNNKVLKNLITSNEIVNIYYEKSSTFEKISMITAIGLLILYILF